jgi:alpha-L-fucosidase 2
MAEAARRSLAGRLGSRYDAQAWSLHWIAALLARLDDAEGAHAALARALGKHTFPNMFVNAHGQPQVGDAHGFAAAVAEMLLQSHEGVVALLPALPAAWPDGNVTGLRARGGLLVSLWWKGGTLVRATLGAQRSGPCVVRTPAPVEVRSDGVILPAQTDAETATGRPTVLTRFAVENGRTYELRAARPARP